MSEMSMFLSLPNHQDHPPPRWPLHTWSWHSWLWYLHLVTDERSESLAKKHVPTCLVPGHGIDVLKVTESMSLFVLEVSTWKRDSKNKILLNMDRFALNHLFPSTIKQAILLLCKYSGDLKSGNI